MENVLYALEGQTHFGMPNSKHCLRACTTSGQNLLILYPTQSMENCRGPTPHEKSHLS